MNEPTTFDWKFFDGFFDRVHYLRVCCEVDDGIDTVNSGGYCF